MKKNSCKIDNDYFDAICWKIKRTEKGKWIFKSLLSILSSYHIWDRNTIKSEFDYSIFYELNNGKQRYSVSGGNSFYEEFLLSDCSESSYEIIKILSNVKRATLDRFFLKELNMKRRPEKDRKDEFERKYGKLSNDTKDFIKKNRLSEINRYENKYEILHDEFNISYGGVSENVSNHQRKMEITDELIEGLKFTDLILLKEIMILEPEVISRKRDVKAESINRKINRLRKKVLSIVRESF